MTISKKAILFMLIAAMAICMSACGGSKTDTASDTTSSVPEESSAPVTGGWAIDDQDLQVKLPEDVEKAFKKAMEALTGATLEPVAYVGSQVVAGTNYMVLCRATSSTENPETKYQMAVIYADLEGNATITNIADLDIAGLSQPSVQE